MNPQKIRVTLVGFGRIAERHLAAIEKLSSEFEIAAVIELQVTRREKAKTMLSVPVLETIDHFTTSDIKTDMFSVLVDSGSHKSVVEELSKFGLPILVEKPYTLSFKSGFELVRYLQSKSIQSFVVKQNRLNPPVKRALDSARDGSLGKILFINASVIWCRRPEYYFADEWRLKRDSDGGVIWNQASHYVDLLVQFAGEIESVFAFGENYLSPAEAEDTVFCVLRSKSGQLISLQATTTARPNNFEGSITVSGSEGLIRVGGHALNEITAWTQDPAHEGGVFAGSESDLSQVYGQSHVGVYQDVSEDLRGEKQSQFRAESGLHVLAVMDAIHESIESKKMVYVDEIIAAANS